MAPERQCLRCDRPAWQGLVCGRCEADEIVLKLIALAGLVVLAIGFLAALH